jgi:hypothetical protein
MRDRGDFIGRLARLINPQPQNGEGRAKIRASQFPGVAIIETTSRAGVPYHRYKVMPNRLLPNGEWTGCRPHN